MVYLIVFIFTLRRRELLKWNSMEFICIVSIFMLSILALQVLSSLLLYKVTAKEEVFSLVPFPDGSVYELTSTSIRVLTDRKGSVY